MVSEKARRSPIAGCVRCDPVETSRYKVNDSMSLYTRDELTEFPASLSPIIPFRDQVLSAATNLADSKFSHAK